MVKNKLRKQSKLPWHVKLPTILYGLRTTPNSVNDKTPAELLNNRRFRTKFDHLNPLTFKDHKDIKTCDENENTQVRSFQVGQTVYFRNSRSHWLKGVIGKKQGICRYIIQWNGKLMKRHINQIQSHGGEERDNRQSTPRGSHCEDGNRTEKDKPGQESDDDDGNDVQVIATPPASKWAEILGVSGQHDYTINQSQQHIPLASKRARSPSSPQDVHAKRLALDCDESLSESDYDPENNGSSENEELRDSEL